MTDLVNLVQLIAIFAVGVVPAIALNRLLAGTEGPGLMDIFAVPAGPPLPRGVQEGEPVRYRVERLTRPVAAPGTGPAAEHLARPVAERLTRPVAASADPSRVTRPGRAVAESSPCG